MSISSAALANAGASAFANAMASSGSVSGSSDPRSSDFSSLISGLQSEGAAGQPDGTDADATNAEDPPPANAAGEAADPNDAAEEDEDDTAADAAATATPPDIAAWLAGLPAVAAGGTGVIDGTDTGTMPGSGGAAARGPGTPAPGTTATAPGASEGDAGTPQALALADMGRGTDSSADMPGEAGSHAEALPGTSSLAAGRGLTDVASFAAAFQRAQGSLGAEGAARAATAHPVLHTAVGTAGWADELGTRLTVLANQGRYTASLQLSPEHLGPLEVRIQMGSERTDVLFGARHADTRAALQDALPRLRELFMAAGLTLGDAGVARDAPRQDAPAQASPGQPFLGEEERVPASVARVVRAAVIRRHAGLLDTYA